MKQLKERYLETMGIVLWKQKSASSDNSNVASNSEQTWQELEKKVKSCTLCDLHKTRKNAVFGAGSKKAELLIVGEAPGATEDEQGEPFVGRAGKLLDSMLMAVGLTREKIFIANILKCRPPNNRDPLPQEVKLCTPYLEKQIELLRPKLIVAVGRIAAHFLLSTDLAMGKLRGQIFSYGKLQTPLLVTYHPAYLLRSPREKAKSYVDMLKIQQALRS